MPGIEVIRLPPLVIFCFNDFVFNIPIMQNPSQKEIVTVIGILKKHRNEFITPALTEIAERSDDPFKVMVSCILSLRTKDATTAGASARLYKLAETPETMMKLPTQKIAKTIYPVGFYKTKAKRIKKICQELVENYSSRVPDDFDLLMKFKGVGRKTANIVMVYGFHKEGLPIDTHCHRVPNRLGWVQTKTPEKTEIALRGLIPKKYWMDFNNIFVQFGQNICKPVRPQCWRCPINKYCDYYRAVYVKQTRQKK